MVVFRSEEMACYQLVVAKSAAYQCMAALGELELVELIPTNQTPDRRPFTKELQVLNELDHKLRKMVKDLKAHHMAALTPDPIPVTPPPSELNNIGGTKRTTLNLFSKLFEEYNEVSQKVDSMKMTLAKLVEKHRALLKGHQYMLGLEKFQAKKGVPSMHLMEKGHIPHPNRFTVQVGGLPSAKINLMETLTWRLMQGNVLIKFFDVEPRIKRGKELRERRSVFLISVQGTKSASMIAKLFSGFGIPIYHMPWKPNERTFLLNRTLERIFELRGILNESIAHKERLLAESAYHCKKWFVEIEKMKMTYIALNSIDWSSLENQVIIEFWVPKSKVKLTFTTFISVTKNEGVSSPALQKIHHVSSSPPTYIRINKFTQGFQAIVDAYGIPSYRELNPMPYTVITFPFLFAVMFGDIGHGTIMASFATTIILFEKRILRHGVTNEIQNLIFKGRYIILMMGLFSVWTGLIYNDFFSKGLFLEYSHWQTKRFTIDDVSSATVKMDPRVDYIGYPMYAGLDPVWKLAENEINFTNAIKMKVAIILGVTQMTFGIILNLFNHLYFKNYLAIFAEFIPQIVFFSCIFIYLVFMFFFKWFIFTAQGNIAESPACAPSLLITFINMMMFSFAPNSGKGCKPEMYPDQGLIQKVLLLTALCMVPIMFFVEPIVEIVKLKRDSSKSNHGEEEGIMSIMVHQFIHVIEFVLGSVSYTASYLRLWALSLAHYQLSSVLWTMVLRIGSDGGVMSIIITLVSFVIFAALTIAILVVIEGLSAFLHALRLHWMEFQSKFYLGIGHYFTPFSFKVILVEAKIPIV